MLKHGHKQWPKYDINLIDPFNKFKRFLSNLVNVFNSPHYIVHCPHHVQRAAELAKVVYVFNCYQAKNLTMYLHMYVGLFTYLFVFCLTILLSYWTDLLAVVCKIILIFSIKLIAPKKWGCLLFLTL